MAPDSTSNTPSWSGRVVWLFTPRGEKKWGIWGWILAALFAALWFYLATALIGQVNQDRTASDQQNNIDLARESGGDWWPAHTDGVVNPLWPWIAARFAPESDGAFFVRGKWVNVSIACAALLLTAGAFRRKVPPPVLVCATLVCGLGCLLPHAVYFQPEPVFYVLFTGIWMIGLVLMRRNPLWLYVVFGALCGFAYLAKASVTPFAAVFVGAGFLRVAWGWWISREGDWSWRRHLAGLVAALVVCSLITLPRALYSKERFGSPYHAYPKYWMWHDDFGTESVPFMAKYADASTLQAIPPEEKPSLSNYLKNHGGEGFRQRLLHGTWEKTWRFYLPERKLGRNEKSGEWKFVLSARGFYLLGYALISAVVAAFGLRSFTRDDWGVFLPRLTLVLGAYAIYSLAYGWYDPIGRGDRFMMTLYMPLVFSLLWAGEGLRSKLAPRSSGWWVYAAGHTGIAVFLFARVAALIRHPMFAP